MLRIAFAQRSKALVWMSHRHAYCGMAVACMDGPPDTRNPFVQKVMAEMRAVKKRPWLEDEEETG